MGGNCDYWLHEETYRTVLLCCRRLGREYDLTRVGSRTIRLELRKSILRNA
jgi:hypothetical protein